jgi:hypothetical protein
LHDCECESGCPACVPPLPPGVTNEELERLLIESNAAQACTRSLLEVLIDGTIAVPKIRTIERERGPETRTAPRRGNDQTHQSPAQSRRDPETET